MSKDSVVLFLKGICSPFTGHKPSKKNIICAGAVLLMVLIIMLMPVPAAMDAHAVIAKAVKNTYDEGSLLYDVLKLKELPAWMEDGSFSAGFGADTEDGQFFIRLDKIDSDHQMELTGSALGLPDIGMAALIKRQTLSINAPVITKDIITYDYRAPYNPTIAEFFGEDKLLGYNRLLQGYYSLWGDQKKLSEDLRKALIDIFEGLDIESLGKQTLTIDGTSRECEGYEAAITYDTLNSFIQSTVSSIESYFEGSGNKEGVENPDSSGTGAAKGENTDNEAGSGKPLGNKASLIEEELKGLFAGFEQATVSIYICDEKITLLNVDSNIGSFSLKLLEGERALDNWVLESEGGSRLSQSLKTQGDIYTYTYNFGIKNKNLYVKYNTSTGDILISTSESDKGDLMALSINSDDEQLSITIDGGRSSGNLRTMFKEAGVNSYRDIVIFAGGAGILGGLDKTQPEDDTTGTGAKGIYTISLSDKPREQLINDEGIVLNELPEDELGDMLYGYITDIEALLYDYDIDYMVYDTLDKAGITDIIFPAKG